jgi:hypothetical protein
MKVLLAAAPHVRAKCPRILVEGLSMDLGTWIKPHMPVELALEVDVEGMGRRTIDLIVQSTGERFHDEVLWEILQLEVRL